MAAFTRILYRLSPLPLGLASFGFLIAHSQERARPVSDINAFRELLSRSKHVVIFTGNGINLESGLKTFLEPNEFWRRYQAPDLATSIAFDNDPSLVWEYYQYRRDSSIKAQPNAAHKAIAQYEQRCKAKGDKIVAVVTQNVDDLQARAGSSDVMELHGSIFKTRCTMCGKVWVNRDNPICPALAEKGQPDAAIQPANIAVENLPRCQSCKGLLRPHVLWFGENLERNSLEKAQPHIDNCDMLVVIGSSVLSYPAITVMQQASLRSVPIAIFNDESTLAAQLYQFHFMGPLTKTVPDALK